MKQTAVEFLENKCSEFETLHYSLPSRLYEYIQQAKEMEKQQKDEFAIGFAIWKETQTTQDDSGLYYGESRIGVSRKNPIDINQLLEIYKKEQGL